MGPSSRGRPPGRCRDRVKEYMCERGATREGGLDQARRVCMCMKVWVQKSRGRLPGKWRDRVQEYMCERGASRGGELDQAKRECLDRERWRLFCHDIPSGSETSEL